MKNQTTQKEYFEQIIALAKANNRQDLADFAQSRIDLLVKKAQSKKPTKVQEANEEYKTTILAVIDGTTVDSGMTATEILKSSDDLADLSNQKVSALLRQLIEAGLVGKTAVKGKTYFYAITDEPDDEVDEPDGNTDDEVDELDDEVQALDGEITV